MENKKEFKLSCSSQVRFPHRQKLSSIERMYFENNAHHCVRPCSDVNNKTEFKRFNRFKNEDERSRYSAPSPSEDYNRGKRDLKDRRPLRTSKPVHSSRIDILYEDSFSDADYNFEHDEKYVDSAYSHFEDSAKQNSALRDRQSLQTRNSNQSYKSEIYDRESFSDVDCKFEDSDEETYGKNSRSRNFEISDRERLGLRVNEPLQSRQSNYNQESDLQEEDIDYRLQGFSSDDDKNKVQTRLNPTGNSSVHKGEFTRLTSGNSEFNYEKLHSVKIKNSCKDSEYSKSSISSHRSSQKYKTEAQTKMHHDTRENAVRTKQTPRNRQIVQEYEVTFNEGNTQSSRHKSFNNQVFPFSTGNENDYEGDANVLCYKQRHWADHSEITLVKKPQKQFVDKDMEYAHSMHFTNEAEAVQSAKGKNIRKRMRHDTIYDNYTFDEHFQAADGCVEHNGRTLSMADARKIAVLLHGQSHAETNLIDSGLRAASGAKDFYVGGVRRCWSKSCWSKSNHSHASVNHEFLTNRDAIYEKLGTTTTGADSFKRKICFPVLTFFKSLFHNLTIWGTTLKRIEGQFGTGIVSYFIFLRWLIFLNSLTFLFYLFLIIFPHVAFSIIPHGEPSITKNQTIFTEEFLNHFPVEEDLTQKSSTKKYQVPKFLNLSGAMIDQDILSYAGTLLDHYIPDEILDLTLYYDRRNRTHEERHNISEYCRRRYVNDLQNTSLHTSNKFEDVLQGTGVLETTLLFLGSYPPKEVAFLGYVYSMPLAFLSVLIISFILSIIMMVQYSSHGIEETMLLRKSNYLLYSNIIFCSWDYCIEDKKSARVRHKSIANEIKNNLAEERRKLEIKEWSNAKKTRVLILRIFVNLFVVLTLLGCYYLIYEVVHYQLKELQLHRIKNIGTNTLFVQYLSPLVITGLNLVVPIIFLSIVKLEMYNTQTQINMALFRIVFLRLSSVFVLVSTLHQQLTCQPRDMCNAGISAACRTPLCWETYVGQQIYKLVITDFFVYILIFICYDIPRDLIVRSCKNKVTELVGRQVFDLPNQVLSLVYSQTLCWLGIFYSPMLPAVTVIKFGILFYIKKRLVLHFSIPPPVPYKASRTNAIFMIILLLSFFAVLIIHGYSVSSIDPSPGCSPFRYEDVMINAIPDAVFSQSPKLTEFINFIFSAFFFFPAYIFLGIAMYYYWTISVTHRKMVKVLRAQIALEGKDKQFLLNRITEAAKEFKFNQNSN